jgi:hypothetical protein
MKYGRMFVNKQLGQMQEGAVVTYSKELCSFGGIEKNSSYVGRSSVEFRIGGIPNMKSSTVSTNGI